MHGSHPLSQDSLSFTLELDSLDQLRDDVALQQRFRAQLDQAPVARLVLQTPPSASALGELAQLLGGTESPDLYGTPAHLDCAAVGDFSAPAKNDDGRARPRTFIESLHIDILQSGWASYGILHTRQVPIAPAASPMVWVDMRALYRSLPGALQERLRQLRGAQHRRATRTEPRPSVLEHPLVAAHPRTQEPLLLLPDRARGSIVGLDPEASSVLLAELWKTADEAAARYERELSSGELYVWDNLSTVHNNPAFPRASARSIWFLNAGCVGEFEAATRA